MALAEIIANVTYWISSFLWVCSQPLYWIHCIYQATCYAVWALFLAIYYGVLYGVVLTEIAFCIWALDSAGYLTPSTLLAIPRGIILMLFNAVKCSGILLIGAVVLFGIWLISAVSSFGILLIKVFGTIFQALKDSLLVTGAMTAVFDAFRVCVADLWEIRTAVLTFVTVMAVKAYLSEILQTIIKAFGLFVDLVVALLSAILYLGICVIVCLFLVLIIFMLYTLLKIALRLGNTMMSRFDPFKKKIVSTENTTTTTTEPSTNTTLTGQLGERDQMCVVCYDQVKNILILPCRHLCFCKKCLDMTTSHARSQGNAAAKCPLCRRAITSSLEVYA